jgi:DNA polymerase-3 subunit gamma/tau
VTYLVLARKYRPKTFDEVVGQRNATATLRGAIEEGRIGHAYLFCGPRGTGKTTTARIFAKALNCEKGPTAEPCGTCERCRAAEDGSEVDIVEIDAASNRGIDDIRSLRESASYRPMRARFKVFIVDEAHMLTKEAVNAFLKTLEEPPPHVKLFFATTEPEKLLPTFVSRCQIVRLELLPEPEIAARLRAVFEKEGIRAGDGCRRGDRAPRARGPARRAVARRPARLARRVRAGAGRPREALAGDRPRGDRGAARPRRGRRPRGDPGRAAGGRGRRARAPARPAGEPPERAARGPRGRRLAPARPRRGRAAPRAGAVRAPRLRPHRDLARGAPARARADRAPEERLPALDPRGDAARPVPRGDLAAARRAGGAPARARGAPRRRGAPNALGAPGALGALGAPRARALGDRRSGSGRPAFARRARARSTGARAPTAPPARAPGRSGGSDEWSALLAALESEARTLGDVLRARGRLEAREPGRATIRLTGLREDERAILAEPRNARIVSAALSRIAGERTEAAFAFAEVNAPKKTASDLFTRQVADSFGGKIVEET